MALKKPILGKTTRTAPAVAAPPLPPSPPELPDAHGAGLDRWDIAILREKSSAVDAEHLNLFHHDSLATMLGDCGFDMVDFSTPGQLDAELVRQQVLSGDVDLSGQPFLQQVLVDGWELLGEHFQGFLAARNLSSHMLAVARRK